MIISIKYSPSKSKIHLSKGVFTKGCDGEDF